MAQNILQSNFDIETWLNCYSQSYQNLSNEEKNSIKNFSLLWSLCECQVFNRSASANNIIIKIRDYHRASLLSINSFQQFIVFFIQRYITDGQLNNTFFSLKFTSQFQQEFVSDALLENPIDPIKIISAIFIIVYRVRNNFFHGEKWLDGFQGQQELFIQSNLFLIKILETSQRA